MQAFACQVYQVQLLNREQDNECWFRRRSKFICPYEPTSISVVAAVVAVVVAVVVAAAARLGDDGLDLPQDGVQLAISPPCNREKERACLRSEEGRKGIWPVILKDRCDTTTTDAAKRGA